MYIETIAASEAPVSRCALFSSLARCALSLASFAVDFIFLKEDILSDLMSDDDVMPPSNKKRHLSSFPSSNYSQLIAE